ncbi:MAG: phosphoribosylamine--glycine ligase [Acidobacteria bacterium RIFCSPLOWO2_12_FULL_54_10]|nr:MAG: phosphoribosylamine--glycine ligase [Acidobacteria bacterium RIFCSPLOWO2_12_FULL_54_10]
MKVLVIGSGGREHALVWKLRQSPSVKQVLCLPGNGGISREAQCVAGDLKKMDRLAEHIASIAPDLTVVGPEAPLASGLSDTLASKGLLVAGPSQAAARLEGSKIFSKQFMRRHDIPTADFVVCEDRETALAAAQRWGGPVVLKADGLAAGKGVVVCSNASESEQAIDALLSGRLVGDAGRRLVIEEALTGEEVSFQVLTDGNTVLPLAPTQDHKAVWDDDRGPNTGGMGVYCDDAILSNALSQRIMKEIVHPTLDGLRKEGITYRGVLYCGLMITKDGPKVLEYNARFGDPETQPLMFRLRTDLAETLLGLARGNLSSRPLEWVPGASVCVVACSAGYPGSYESGKIISGIEQAEAAGAKIFHAGTTSNNHDFLTAGGRVLGITARGETLAAATRNAYHAVSCIHFDGMHYRHDIAQKGLRRSQPL